MKKIIATLSLLLIAGSTFAASINWNVGSSDKIKFDTKSVGKNATVFFVYLGSETLSNTSFADVIAATPVTSATTSSGYIPDGTKIVTDSANVGNYVAYASYVSEEKTYYNISSTVFTLTSAAVSDLINNGVAIESPSYDFSSSVNSDTATPSAGGGWYAAVPEPSTAALALAGLALLLKRRKA